MLACLRDGAQGRAGELETQARRQIVLALVAALEPIVAKIGELTIEIRHPLDADPDGATFRSLFIAPDSWLYAATLLAEIGDCVRARDASQSGRLGFAGQPVGVVATRVGEDRAHHLTVEVHRAGAQRRVAVELGRPAGSPSVAGSPLL